YVAAQLSAVESLRTGTTGVMDHLITGPFPKEDAVHATFRAYADVGIRATVAPIYADVPQVDGLPWKDELIPPELGAPPREWDHDALFALLDRLRAAYHGSHGDRLRIGLGP